MNHTKTTKLTPIVTILIRITYVVISFIMLFGIYLMFTTDIGINSFYWILIPLLCSSFVYFINKVVLGKTQKVGSP